MLHCRLLPRTRLQFLVPTWRLGTVSNSSSRDPAPPSDFRGHCTHMVTHLEAKYTTRKMKLRLGVGVRAAENFLGSQE